MDIVCPTCAAAYEIDEATVGIDGRKVRCAACSTVWRAFRADPAVIEAPPPVWTGEGEPPSAEKEAEAIEWSGIQPESDQEKPSDPPIPASQPASGKARWVKDKAASSKGSRRSTTSRAALGTIAATVMLVAVGIHQRALIVHHVPQSARLFAVLGMPVNLRGIEIKGVASRILDDNGVSVLIVDGDLINTTARRVDVPRLRFAVISSAGQEVYVWSAQADRNILQPGETLNFRRRLAAPPAEAKDVSVRFVTKADITAGIK